MFEVRVVVGFDAARARSIQRSFSVHGDAAEAARVCAEMVAEHGATYLARHEGRSLVTVGELLERYVASPHSWKPATVTSHRHVVMRLLDDPLARYRVEAVCPALLRTAIWRWQGAGVSVPKVSARWLIVRGALSWAVTEGIVRHNPLVGMKGPPRPSPRRHHTLEEVGRLIDSATLRAARAESASIRRPDSALLQERFFAADQTVLLVRLAADSGARRGELAALRRRDLAGRVLTIERNLSAGVLGSTKSGRTRRITLGATTVEMIEQHVARWAVRVQPIDDWLFSPTPERRKCTRADVLSHRFARLGQTAGVEQAALHRIRHGVATYLVGQGHLVKAQARLGHRDPSTTLRHYSHAMPLDDQDIADDIDELLNGDSC